MDTEPRPGPLGASHCGSPRHGRSRSRRCAESVNLCLKNDPWLGTENGPSIGSVFRPRNTVFYCRSGKRSCFQGRFPYPNWGCFLHKLNMFFALAGEHFPPSRRSQELSHGPHSKDRFRPQGIIHYPGSSSNLRAARLFVNAAQAARGGQQKNTATLVVTRYVTATSSSCATRRLSVVSSERAPPGTERGCYQSHELIAEAIRMPREHEGRCEQGPPGALVSDSDAISRTPTMFFLLRRHAKLRKSPRRTIVTPCCPPNLVRLTGSIWVRFLILIFRESDITESETSNMDPKCPSTLKHGTGAKVGLPRADAANVWEARTSSAHTENWLQV